MFFHKIYDLQVVTSVMFSVLFFKLFSVLSGVLNCLMFVELIHFQIKGLRKINATYSAQSGPLYII